MELMTKELRARHWSASHIAPSLKRFTAARLCWRAVKVAQNWYATSISCRARAGVVCSIAGCGRGRHSDCAAD